MQLRLLRPVVQRLEAITGGRLRLAVSGGGSLPRHVDETLLGIGLPLLNGYGLTETSPVASVRLPQANCAGTIGPPLPDTEIRARDLDVKVPAKLAALTIITRELAQDASKEATSVVGQALSNDISAKLDSAFFGSAVQYGPSGIGSVAGVHPVTSAFEDLDGFAEAQSLIETAGANVTAFITSQVARYGHGAVAGFGMAARLEGVTLMALMALSAAMTPFTGQNFGAGRLDRVREGVSFAYRFALIYGITVGLLMFAGAGLLTQAFGLEPDAREAALLQLRIVPFSYVALGVSMTVNGALNALGKPMAAMFVSLSRTIAVYAPLAWVLSHFFGLVGIFIAAASANLISGAIGAAWFRLAYNETVADFQAKAATQQA